MNTDRQNNTDQKYKFLVPDGSGYIMNYEVIDALVPQTTLFIHGNMASNRWWHPTVDVLKRTNSTSKNNRGQVILAEFRGCGESSAPHSENEIKITTFAADFIALVKAKNVGPINLVGHSTGGLVAAYMLALAPELFNKAVLLDPVGAKGISTFNSIMKNIFSRMKDNRPLVSFVMSATVYQSQEQNDFFQSVIVEDAFTAVKNVGYWVVQAMSGLDSKAIYQKIPHPVLVLHGEHDELLPLEDSKEVARLIPQAEMQIIPRCGHCTNVENPELFTKIVTEFLFNS